MPGFYSLFKTYKMTKEALKVKVIARLLNNGNNAEDVLKMVDEHFDYASKTYKTVKVIAECIRSIY